MRKFSVENKLQKYLSKTKNKDPVLFLATKKKMKEILECQDLDHYKNLRKPLQEYKRVHVKSSFVLIFKHEKQTDEVTFVDLDHHDRIYIVN